jgi:hypothetical protein
MTRTQPRSSTARSFAMRSGARVVYVLSCGNLNLDQLRGLAWN